MKKALVTRYGAIGDFIIMTPVLSQLKRAGYHITMDTVPMGRLILKHNPYIDAWHDHDTAIPADKLTEHFAEISKGYDLHVNLCESLEGTLLKVSWRDDFKKTKEELHVECNVNYYDRALEIAGFPEIKGLNGELYFSADEIGWARKFLKKLPGRYVVLWSLSGSSVHKAYPYTEEVGNAFLARHENAVIVTLGDELCQLLEWSHPRVIRKAGLLPIRKSLALTMQAHCVIGTETGVLNAAACFDTPKVLLLSHSSEENLSKYWKNCISLSLGQGCQPCHKLHYGPEHCDMDFETLASRCMKDIPAARVLNALETHYSLTKEAAIWQHQPQPILQP